MWPTGGGGNVFADNPQSATEDLAGLDVRKRLDKLLRDGWPEIWELLDDLAKATSAALLSPVDCHHSPDECDHVDSCRVV